MHKDTILFYSILGFAILGLTLAITNPFDLPLIYAEENKIIGKNYNDELLSIDADGKELHRWISTPERISTDGNYWHDYYFQIIENVLRFESSVMSYEFSINTSVFKIWSGGLIEQRSPEIPSFSTTLKTAINGTDDWSPYPLIESSYSFSDIQYGKQIELTQNHNDVILKTIFNIATDTGLKWTYEITNISKENSKFGITTVCNNCGEIEIDGIKYLNGEWSKADLIKEPGAYKKIKINGFDFDPQDYEHDYLWAFKNVNGNIIFDFTYSKGVLEIGETLVIDPTFGYSVYDSKGRSYATRSGDCGGETISGGDGDTVILETATGCQPNWFKFDVTSIDDSLSTVSSANIKYTHTLDSSPLTQNCVARSYDSEPSTNSQATYDSAYSSPKITDPDSSCFNSVSDQVIAFNSNGRTDIVSKISGGNNWYGIFYGTDDLSAIQPAYTNISTMSLEITYLTTSPPDPITDLSLDSVGSTSAQVSFTAPDLNGETLINYMLNVTTPQTNPVPDFNQNSTSTTFSISGLSMGTSYSAQASAYTVGGSAWTGANVLNFTTSTANAPFAVTNLTATTLNFTSIELQWIEPNLQGGNVSGYRILSDTTSPPVSILVSTTGNSDLGYNVTGLNPNTLYYFLVSVITEGGTNMTGTIASAATGDPAQPVKDFLATLEGVGIDDTFGLEIGLAGLVMIFGVGLAQKNMVYGSLMFVIILGFAVYYGLVTVPTTIFSTIIFFTILIIFSAKNRHL